MSNSVPVKLSQTFCSYCGRPPKDTVERTSRVCVNCELGMILRAPEGDAPRPRDPFLIVDDKLTVQAISRSAEKALGVAEPDGVCELVEEFLRPADGKRERTDVAMLLELAAAGVPRADTVELSSVNEPRRRFRGRVTSCGHPRAALLVLAPQADTADTPDDPDRTTSNGAGPAHSGASAR
jgi:hypothetical protein